MNGECVKEEAKQEVPFREADKHVATIRRRILLISVTGETLKTNTTPGASGRTGSPAELLWVFRVCLHPSEAADQMTQL